jgi:hypothetical protein
MIWSYIFWTAPTRCPGKALVEAWEKVKFLSSGGFQKWGFLNSWIVDHGTSPSKMEELGIFGVIIPISGIEHPKLKWMISQPLFWGNSLVIG